jgi:thiol-disulfide isomerase/thioredoxin
MAKPTPALSERADGATLPRWLAPAILALGVIGAFALARPPSTSTATPTTDSPTEDFGPVLSPGTLAPNFSVERLEGGTINLSALKGRVVLLDFWATWCPPCRAELPWLVPLVKRYESRGLAFVALSQDNPAEQRALVTRFAAELPGFSRYAALGTHAVGRDYGAESLPMLYLIDRSGRVYASKVGAAEQDEVAQAIEHALAATP